MDLETLKPNSNKYKREKESKNLAKVVTGDVKVKKKSKGRRILDLFIEEDGVNVREYLIFELLIPAIKDTLVDIIQRSSMEESEEATSEMAMAEQLMCHTVVIPTNRSRLVLEPGRYILLTILSSSREEKRKECSRSSVT